MGENGETFALFRQAVESPSSNVEIRVRGTENKDEDAGVDE